MFVLVTTKLLNRLNSYSYFIIAVINRKLIDIRV